jgi:hypothetical protein
VIEIPPTQWVGLSSSTYDARRAGLLVLPLARPSRRDRRARGSRLILDPTMGRLRLNDPRTAVWGIYEMLCGCDGVRILNE